MLETIQNGLGAAALLLVLYLPHGLGDQAVGISSQGTLNLALSPLSDCPARTINYITQISSPQCAETAWIPQPASVGRASDSLHFTADGFQAAPSVVEETTITAVPSSQASADTTSVQIPSISDTENITGDGSTTGQSSRKSNVTAEVSQDIDSESPLDTANFLSFEEWKKQNLAKAGQSVETVGGRPVVAGTESRRRPGSIVNALDSLGEDTEIEIDFGGFVNSGKSTYEPSPQRDTPDENRMTGEGGVHQNRHERAAASSHTRGKDAGKTCKERFNYASFDCAATVLKTNKESKGSTSVLVENKDSYMLNKCSADNKFFIVELCEDILVDTVVLANFEFFSSMFRTFRVSVSDRYPVKLDKWRELGTFEARNSREVQAFLVESPLIWARYLRVEFLAHYGNEYHCPVSLLRVHGTTMMEEFNHDMKSMREEEEIELENGEEGDSEGLGSGSQVVIADALKEVLLIPKKIAEKTEIAPSLVPPSQGPILQASATQQASSSPGVSATGVCLIDPLLGSRLEAAMSALDDKSLVCPLDGWKQEASYSMTPSVKADTTSTNSKKIDQVSPSTLTETLSPEDNRLPGSTNSIEHSASDSTATSDPGHAENYPAPTTASKATNYMSQSSVRISASSTQPPAANPTTQESFFKSVHKRLQLLESNSTLSLQYIEEQSRILRDAFSKVEKRQLAKTTNFLESLNTTVFNEIHAFRNQYDHIWQSTVLELSSQREQSRKEVTALSARLSVLADEIVFQKRMAILQFVLILLCLGLVIFSRASPSSAVLLQSVVDKSSANLARYTHFETPRSSPSSTRPSSRYGIFARGPSAARSPSEESDSGAASAGMNGEGNENVTWNGANGPIIECSPPTPTSSQNRDDEKRESSDVENADSPESGADGENGSSVRSDSVDVPRGSRPRRQLRVQGPYLNGT
ncbi:hypothetical protein MMC07_007714 [Pseudocyphellaria aurata]|nr:hypothetical protein [Pseudocyphellaria aurata]